MNKGEKKKGGACEFKTFISTNYFAVLICSNRSGGVGEDKRNELKFWNRVFACFFFQISKIEYKIPHTTQIAEPQLFQNYV
jgi:hypothetical protein